jgi:hypothetical protein
LLHCADVTDLQYINCIAIIEVEAFKLFQFAVHNFYPTVVAFVKKFLLVRLMPQTISILLKGGELYMTLTSKNITKI